MGLQAREKEKAAVRASNLVVQHLIKAMQAQLDSFGAVDPALIASRNAAKERTHFLFEFILMAVIVVLIAWELLQMLNE